MSPSPLIRLRLLGRFAACRSDGPAHPIRFATRKSGALLAYLAMNAEQTASREELAALLWGSSTDQQARQSLRQSLALLRKELGDPQPFTANSEVVRLQPGVWSVDARDFDDLTRSQAADELNRAAGLFGGEFLSGTNIEEEGFEEWVRAQRHRTQLAAFRLCETFASRPDLVSDAQCAVTAAERLVGLDPLREDWQRIALTLYARYRGKTEALAQAEAYATVLRRELDVGPDSETRALIDRIRAGDIAPQPITTGERNTPSNSDLPASIIIPPFRSDLIDRRSEPNSTTPAFEPQRWGMRAFAAGLAIVALLLAGGSLALTYGSVFGELVASTKRAEPSVADPWQSPLPTSSQIVSNQGLDRKGVLPVIIMPFKSHDDAAGSSQLRADMLTDNLTNMLSRNRNFRVISHQTARKYQAQSADLATIGTELGVRYVLEGSIRFQGDALRVNVELIDPVTRTAIWSSRIEREGADRHGVQDEIVGRLARELHVETYPIESARLSTDADADALAYRGWAAMQSAYSQIGIQAYEDAKAHFANALERDPQHISALMGMAAYHANIAVQRLVPDVKEQLEKARAILSDVLERDPNNGVAYHLLGIALEGGGNLKEAVEAFGRAIEINPSNAGSHAHIGFALARMGRAAEGIDYVRYALRLSPKDPALSIWLEFAGHAELELNHYDAAVENFRRSASINAGYPRPWAGMVAALTLAGRPDDARSRLEKLKAIAPGLNTHQLLERFGRRKDSRLYAGLMLALAEPNDAWRSPRMPGSGSARSPAVSRDIIPIAILPFKTFDEMDGTMRIDADMMSDDLINALSRVGNLRVISRQTSRSYQGHPVDVATIGSELGVRYVLEGSVRKHADKLRVNVELIDPVTRLPAWSTRIERADADHDTVHDEIVARLARELHFEIYHAEGLRAQQDSNAGRLNYLGWAALFDSGTEGLKALERAKTAFKEVHARDPQNLGATAGLGAYHAMIGSLQLVPDWKAHLLEGERTMSEALRKRPNASAWYLFLALAQRAQGKVDQAIESLTRCLDLSPSAAQCYAHLGHALVQKGRSVEGVEHIRYALRLSPRDPSRSHWLRFAGEAEMELAHFDQALAYLRESLKLNARQPLTERALAAALALSNRLDEARQHLSKARETASHMSDEFLTNRSMQIERKQPEFARGLRLVLSPPT